MAKQTGSYSNEALKGEKGGKSDFYETFDSGSGVVIPDGMESDFAHNDSGSNLGNSTNLDSADGGVPEVPMKKR